MLTGMSFFFLSDLVNKRLGILNIVKLTEYKEDETVVVGQKDE